MQDFSLLTEFDIHLFRAGKHFKLYEKLGSHLVEVGGVAGTYFAVWAPNALSVSATGSFNGWNANAHPLQARWDGSGIWEGFVPHAAKGDLYKYAIKAPNGRMMHKGDPFARRWETPPSTACMIWDTKHYAWKDEKWLAQRKEKANQPQPMSVYEVHIGSWRKGEGGRFLSYVELAEQLVAYVKELGFTHVEFMPVMEHPFYGSWGYQVTGYFAPSNRQGTPEEFMFLIDKLHEAGIGVLLDWVPSHFPEDAHGLAMFDGTRLFEHSDPRKGWHPDWKSLIFNLGRYEVCSFLISNALFWIDQFHADGLRVDAVASMLYLDYSRKAGEWIPNEYGGNENLESIEFLREFNETVYREFPDVVTIAEESTAFAGVSRPVYDGGLGFGQKWMMGWMHDTLNYFKRPTIYRRWHQSELTFSLIYAFSENFMLPLSHDEVVHGKGSLLQRMPGDEWQKFANLRLLFTYMFTHPGTKLLFMGSEFAQSHEWNHDLGLNWWLSEFQHHKGMQAAVRDLNSVYKNTPALYEKGFSPEGFEWIDMSDTQNCVMSYLRKGNEHTPPVMVVLNLTPNVHVEYRIGSHDAGVWTEIFNSDDTRYTGSGQLNPTPIATQASVWQGKNHSVTLRLPPLAATILIFEKEKIKLIEKKKTEKISVAKSKK